MTVRSDETTKEGRRVEKSRQHGEVTTPEKRQPRRFEEHRPAAGRRSRASPGACGSGQVQIKAVSSRSVRRLDLGPRGDQARSNPCPASEQRSLSPHAGRGPARRSRRRNRERGRGGCAASPTCCWSRGRAGAQGPPVRSDEEREETMAAKPLPPVVLHCTKRLHRLLAESNRIELNGITWSEQLVNKNEIV